MAPGSPGRGGAGRRRARSLGLLAASVLLVACAARGPAPVAERGVSDPPASGYHRVATGDTLYSIAWRYGISWQSLARRNGIAAPYTIVPGQRLRIVGGAVAAAPAASAPPAPRAESTRPSRPAARPAPVPARPASTTASAGPIEWSWPLEGEIVRPYRTSGDDPNKGLDIRGAPGASVRAAAAGQVVYAGAGLRGHARLVIVKHDDRWLSAYAHDDEILVSEGQQLEAGASLARLASAGRSPRVLHFEIRREGKPVNPTGLLPRR